MADSKCIITGTFSSPTVTVNVTFPTGEVTVLHTFATFVLPRAIAALLPLIDGEQVERLMGAATYGQLSTVTLIRQEIRVDHLPPKDQALVANGWEAMLKNQR